MSRPLAAGQPSTTVAAKPNVIVAAPVRYAETKAGPLSILGTPPPAPFYPMGPPSAFPPVMPPGTFPGPRAYLHPPPPPPPPPPGVPGPYPGTPSLPSVDPRYIAQYPVCPGPPGIPRSLRFPPPGDFSYQGPALIHGIVDPMTMARPAVPPVAPPDIPHFKIYIGKIAPTVDNDFILSLLQVCGVVKSWEPSTNPIDGTHTRFGFCVFETAEGCLRARRLLNKLSIDDQESVLNVDEATRHVPFRYTDADKDAMQRIRSMIEERMENKLPRLPTPPFQVSACTVDDNGNDDAQSSALERKIRRKEEHLGGRKAVGFQGKKDREVTAAGKSSLQIDAAPSVHVPMEHESTVEHKRKSQHRKRGGFRKSNGEGKGRERKSVGSEGRKDREVTAVGKPSLQIGEAPLMHVRMERESAVEHERKNQHMKRDGFRKSNGEEKGRERRAVGSEGRKDREVSAAGKFSLQIDEAPSMHDPMECEFAVEHERKNQHRKRNVVCNSNGEEKGIVFVPGLVSDKQSTSAREKVCFKLQATSNSGVKKTLDAKQLHATVPKMIEEGMKSKLSGSPTPAVQVSRIVEENGDEDTGRSSLEERKIRRQCEKEEPLGERNVVGSKGWKVQVDAALSMHVRTECESTDERRMSSLQVYAATSMHIPTGCESTVEHERNSQHRERELIMNRDEDRMTSKFPCLSTPPAQPSANIIDEKCDNDMSSDLEEGEISRESETEGQLMSSLQVDAAPSMHVPTECESTVEHERKIQHRERELLMNSDEDRMTSKIPCLSTPPAQPCANIIDEEWDNDKRSSDLEEGEIIRQCEISSLQVDVPPLMHVPTECGSTVELGVSSLQAYAAPSMHVPMECESTIQHERKSQHRERDGFPKSNGEERCIVFVPGLVSDTQNISAGEKVVLELQATSKLGDKKSLDVKQLLATVPKMKEELFAHDVNWAIYDKHGLHERVRPWISKKATEVFGEELAEFVDYVVATTKEHVTAPRMLELLESLLDDDAEKFVLLMWRKLIFEIKKVEEGY